MSNFIFSKVFFGSDHAGFELKEVLKNKLLEKVGSISIIDYGVHNSNERKDYPVYAKAVCDSVVSSNQHCGILVCSTGIGMSIAANRFSNIRAGLCHSLECVELARSHNDANVLVLSQLLTDYDYAVEMMYKFLETKFNSTSERYLNRINMMK